MANSNGKITASVRQRDDVAVVLGVGTTNVALSYLNGNSHGKTNQNAKYKPSRNWPYSTCRNAGDNNNLIQQGGKYYWQGSDGWCSMNIPNSTQIITSQNDDSVWGYNAPTGGANSPYRLSDWIGYNHNATYNWGTISVAERIVKGSSSSMNIGLNMLTINSDSLCYFDMFTPSYTEDPKGLYLSFVKNGSQVSIEKRLNAFTDGKMTVTLSSTDINSLGLSIGNYMNVHFYGKDSNGTIKSLRNNTNTKTFWQVKTISSDPYTLSFSGEVLHKNGTYDYKIYNLQLRLDATNYAGGTMAAGTKIKIFEYKAGTAINSYNSLYSPIWQSATLGAITVSSGSIVNAFDSANNATFTNYNSTITNVAIIAYDSGNSVIASLANKLVQNVSNW